MKITSFQLEQQLKKTLSKIYIVCGEEPFLVQEALDLIRQKALASGYQDRLRIDLESEADFEGCYTHAYTPPFLNQKRLLELHCKAKLSKAGQQFLNAYALKPSPHTLILVRLGKIDSKTEQTQWFKALEKLAVIIPIWPLPQKQLAAWLMQRAKVQNLQLNLEAAEALAHYVEGNLSAAAQEIEKLSLSGHSHIDRSLIESMVSDQGCFSSFDLLDQALSGNSAQALRILNYLQKEGTEPLMILGAFVHELRTLTKLARELKKGSSLSSLFAQYYVRQSRQNPVREFLKRNNEENCLFLLLKAGEIDRIVKGALPGNSWEALQGFIGATSLTPTIFCNYHI